MALKVKNTNLTNYPNCLKLLQFAATGWNVKLFQRKNVHELIWGYTDVLLGTLVSFKTEECPSSATEGASSFVQLQVCGTVKLTFQKPEPADTLAISRGQTLRDAHFWPNLLKGVLSA